MKNKLKTDIARIATVTLLALIIGSATGQPVIAQSMTLTQTLSDEGQRNTIAFSALSFITGSLGADSFFPPGKVADFWGFQYMRDNDPTGMGHNTDFLTKAANNMLYILDEGDRERLIALAESQVDSINNYAYLRFPLMQAFRDLLEGNEPDGASGLDLDMVKAYSARLYRLDGEITLQRAEVMGTILAGLDEHQRAYLEGLRGIGMLNWPDVGDQVSPQSMDHDTHVALMTYAGDLFSWYLGSLEADVYFAPERQGTYFGSFYMKDAPAMGNADYVIDETLTGNIGQTTLALLNSEQASLLTDMVESQRNALMEIADTREAISILLRRAMAGEAMDHDTVMELMTRYGELDGEIVHRYATHFVALNQSLTTDQQAAFFDLRKQALGDYTPSGAFLYSEPIPLPEESPVDYLFRTESIGCDPSGVASAENVEYNGMERTLSLSQLEFDSNRYAVEMKHDQHVIFKLIDVRVEEYRGDSVSGCYDARMHTASIPRVLVNGQTYSAILKQAGDWRFYVASLTPVHE